MTEPREKLLKFVGCRDQEILHNHYEYYKSKKEDVVSVRYYQRSPIRNRLRKVGILHWLYKKLLIRYYKETYEEKYPIRSVVKKPAKDRFWYYYENSYQLEKVINVLEDNRSVAILQRLLKVSCYAAIRDQLPLRKIYGALDTKLWKKEAWFLDSTKYNPISNEFIIGGMRFYYAPPAPNVIINDHGFLDYDAPRLPKEYDAIFDVGAYVGDSALILSSYLSPKGKIYSFEPDSDYASAARKNIKRYKLSNKVKIIEKYVGKETRGRWVSMSNYSNKKALDPAGTYLIKLDVEGYEREVLKSSRDLLKKYKPVVIVAIYHLPDDLNRILEIIQSSYSGYAFYLRHHSRPTPYDEYYLVAIPDDIL